MLVSWETVTIISLIDYTHLAILRFSFQVGLLQTFNKALKGYTNGNFVLGYSIWTVLFDYYDSTAIKYIVFLITLISIEF